MIYIDNVVITEGGTAQAYVMPDSFSSIAFHAKDGYAKIGLASDATEFWTLAEGDKEILSDKDLQGRTIYITGETTNDVVEVRTITNA